MKYCFILGNNPTLSIAELSSVFNLNLKKDELPNGDLVSNNIFVLETDKKIDAAKLIKEIGGTVKVGMTNYELRMTNNDEELFNHAIKLIDKKNIIGKFKFGISYYGEKKFDIKPLAMEIKKYLRGKNISSRWVTSREETLSSVVVEQNKLISDNGIEIVLMEEFNPPIPPFEGGHAKSPLVKEGGRVLIGQTLAVQPFKELSFRDYGRPARDDYSGMLPPKLAQIMINLALPHPSISPLLIRRGDGDEVILDPFCGSGTILTEAMLMGFRNIIGADISKKAVEDTEKNIEWIIKNYELRITNYELFNKNVLELSKFVKPNSVDAIVTEPYLGPQRGKIDFSKVKKELEDLYSKSLAEFKKVLKPEGKVVMAWPVFHETRNMKHITLNFNLNDFKIINPIPENLRKNKFIKFTPLEYNSFPKKSLHDAKTLTGLTNRNTIIYGREGQKIWREIIILKKAMPF